MKWITTRQYEIYKRSDKIFQYNEKCTCISCDVQSLLSTRALSILLMSVDAVVVIVAIYWLNCSNVFSFVSFYFQTLNYCLKNLFYGKRISMTHLSLTALWKMASHKMKHMCFIGSKDNKQCAGKRCHFWLNSKHNFLQHDIKWRFYFRSDTFVGVFIFIYVIGIYIFCPESRTVWVGKLIIFVWLLPTCLW